MVNEYKIGDIVIISKLFVRAPHGRWSDCMPTTAEVVNIEHTPTHGPAYTLKVDGSTLPICYWESDIDYLHNTDPDAIWKIFGDQ